MGVPLVSALLECSQKRFPSGAQGQAVLKMEPTEGSETSAALKLTPGKYPKEDIQQITLTCLFHVCAHRLKPYSSGFISLEIREGNCP
jgi:hypothetical protein